MGLRFDPEAKKQTIAELRRYLADEMDLDVGDLQAELLLEHLLKQVGPTIYNTAVRDAQSWLQEKLLDLDGEVFEDGGPGGK